MAELGRTIWMEYGATGYMECLAEDVPHGEHTSFPRAVQAKDGETVIFSWIEWPSRKVRDEGWEKAQNDPRMKAMKMPFDGQRMIYGGFSTMLDA